MNPFDDRKQRLEFECTSDGSPSEAEADMLDKVIRRGEADNTVISAPRGMGMSALALDEAASSIHVKQLVKVRQGFDRNEAKRPGGPASTIE